MNTITKLIYACLVVAFTIQSVTGQRDFPDLNYASGTLGKELQPFFVGHCAACGFFVPKRLQEYRDSKDFIVTDVKEALTPNDLLNKKVNAVAVDVIEMFSYIGKVAEKKILGEYKPNLEFYDYLVVNYSAPTVGNYTMYSKNCFGYYKGTANARAKFPGAAAEASASADETFSSIILINEGTFINPIHSLWTKNDPEIMFHIWNFYLSNPAYLNDAYYLQQFKGAIVTNKLDREANAKFDLAARVSKGVNGGVASADIKASAELTKSVADLLKSKGSKVMVYSDEVSNAFVNLPTPKEVSDKIPLYIKVEFKIVDKFYSKEATDFTHKLVVKGLPSNMAADFWELIEVNPSGVEIVDKTHAFYGGSVDLRPTVLDDRSVEYTIVGPINKANFGDASLASLQLRYKLRSKAPVSGLKLELPVVETPIPTSEHPRITIRDNIEHGTLSVSSDNSVQTWTVNFGVLDDPGVVDKQRPIRITKAKIYKGANVLEVDYKDENIVFNDGNDFSIKLKSKASFPSTKEKYDDVYNLELTVQMFTRNGVIERTGPGTLKVFRDKEAARPLVEITPLGFDTQISAWNFNVSLTKGDVDFDPLGSTFATLDLTDESTNLKFGNAPMALLLKPQGTNQYPLNVPCPSNTTQPYPKIVRNVILKGQILVPTIDGGTLVSYKKTVPLLVPYVPLITIEKTSSTPTQKGKNLWKGEITIDDGLKLVDSNSKWKAVGSTTVNNKSYKIKVKLVRITDTRYSFEAEFEDGSLKFDQAASQFDYPIDMSVTIDVNQGLSTTANSTLKIAGLTITAL